MKDNTQVKRHVRKGKVVKSHRRKVLNKRSNKDTRNRNAYITASVLGVPPSTSLALKYRYRANLNKEIDKLKTTNFSTKVDIKPNQKGVSIAVSGFYQPKRGIKAEDVSRYMNAGMRRQTKGYKKLVFSFDARTAMSAITKPGTVGSTEHALRYWSKGVLKGRNEDAIKLAREAAGIAQKYPDKAINLVGFSQGAVVSREAAYLLQEAGYKNVSYVGIGGSNFKMLPKTPKGLEIMGTGDHTRKFNFSNPTKIAGVNKHTLKEYLTNSKVKSLISKVYT